MGVVHCGVEGAQLGLLIPTLFSWDSALGRGTGKGEARMKMERRGGSRMKKRRGAIFG